MRALSLALRVLLAAALLALGGCASLPPFEPQPLSRAPDVASVAQTPLARVARIAVLLGKQLGISPTILGDLFLAGLLHDLGKIGVRDEVLWKMGKLSAAEFDEVKQHSSIGERIVGAIEPLRELRQPALQDPPFGHEPDHHVERRPRTAQHGHAGRQVAEQPLDVVGRVEQRDPVLLLDPELLRQRRPRIPGHGTEW